MKNNQMITAAGLLFTMHAAAQSTVYSGSGFGTYYYDIENTNQCSTDFSDANTGQVECSLTQAWTLENVNSDYLVAMNHTQLVGDMASYCGKKVIVSVNGVASDLPLFIGDGCVRCATGSSDSTTWSPDGAPGLDFSYTVAEQLSNEACTDGHIEITWEIVDELIYDFDYSGSGKAQGFVSGDATSAASTSTSTSTSAPISLTTITTATASPATTLVTQPLTTSSATSFSTLTTSTVIASTATGSADNFDNSEDTEASSGSCNEGDWKCTSSGSALVQCLSNVWTVRETCTSGRTCQGGSSPYCI